MEKRWVRVLGVAVFLGVLSVHASRGWALGEEEMIHPLDMEAVNIEISEETESEDNALFLMDTEAIIESNTEVEEESGSENDTIVFYENVKLLEEDLFGDNFIDEMGKMIYRGMSVYSEEVKGEFTPVIPEGTTLPEGLITLMEEAFYNSTNANLGGDADNSFYAEKIKELGGEEFNLKLEDAYELFPQISEHREEIEDEYDAYIWIAKLYDVDGEDPYDCMNILHLGLIDGRDYYVFRYRSGGTSRDSYLYLMERIGDEFVEIDIFGSTSSGRGTVIKYDGKFYYVALQDNDSLKDYDGIRLYSLNDNVREDNLSIRYLPEKYIWTSLYQLEDMEDEVKEELNLYMEKIKEEFTPGTYLGDEMHAYFGDEENAPSMNVKTSIIDSGSTVYLVDVANCGRPVYFFKILRCPNCCSQYLNVILYRRSLRVGAVEEPDIDINSSRLVQTWFKEICGKVYTCQVYHLTDYNYIFRIVLLEEDELTTVRTEMVAPQRKFVVGNGFYWGM